MGLAPACLVVLMCSLPCVTPCVQRSRRFIVCLYVCIISVDLALLTRGFWRQAVTQQQPFNREDK